MVPQFTPQKNGQLEGPAPQGLGPVLRVVKLSFWMIREAIPFISLLPFSFTSMSLSPLLAVWLWKLLWVEP